MLGDMTMPSTVLPLHLKQTFQPIIWILTEGEGDGIEPRLPLRIFSTLLGVAKNLGNELTPKEDTCCTNKSLKRFVSRSEEVEHRLLPPFNAAWYDTLQIIHTYLQVNRTKFWFWWSGGKIYKEEEALYLNVRSLGNLSCVKLSSLPSKRFSLKRI